MPIDHIILNIEGYKIEKISEEKPYRITVKYIGKITCPHCNDKRLRNKGKYKRKVRHTDIHNKTIMLELKGNKYQCKSCKKYFNQRFPGVKPYRKYTEAFRKDIFERHRDGVCQKRISENKGIGQATVERWYKDYLKRKVSETNNYPLPTILGIDEHFFTKKQGYATTICDLKNHKVYDVVLGRSESSLRSYLNKLKGRDNVKVVVIDLSETYRLIIEEYFPNAKIVADRFHVIRLVNQHFMKFWKELDPDNRWNRGLLSLIRRHEENLKPEQRDRLYKYFEKYPELQAVYEFKQKLNKLLLKKNRTKKQCKKMIRKYLKYLQEMKGTMLEKLGKTLESWSEEIVRMWRFSKSNGITEGFHTKMEMISRRAYGFRNFDNYRLRVRALCS